MGACDFSTGRCARLPDPPLKGQMMNKPESQAKALINFTASLDVISQIDRLASQEAISRASWVRRSVLQALRQAQKETA
jgi:hypothetical protein